MGGALEARHIAASGDLLTALARGEVEVEDGVLIIKRIHVIFTLKGIGAGDVAAAERAHDIFKPKCPIYQSLYRAIDITTELNLR